MLQVDATSGVTAAVLLQLLVLEPEQRLKLADVPHHPWIRNNLPSSSPKA